MVLRMSDGGMTRSPADFMDEDVEDTLVSEKAALAVLEPSCPEESDIFRRFLDCFIPAWVTTFHRVFFS